jgi:hypothetical protein
MANADRPFGFRFHSTRHGGPPQLTEYKSTAAAIYPGDVVKKDGSGRILAVTAAADNPMGVAASYGDATAGNVIQVYDDLLNTFFEVQVDDATLTDDTVIGNFYDQTVTTGDTTTLQSKQELDGDASAQDTLTIRGLVNRPDNAWGAWAKVIVQIRVDSQAPVIAST